MVIRDRSKRFIKQRLEIMCITKMDSNNLKKKRPRWDNKVLKIKEILYSYNI